MSVTLRALRVKTIKISTIFYLLNANERSVKKLSRPAGPLANKTIDE